MREGALGNSIWTKGHSALGVVHSLITCFFKLWRVELINNKSKQKLCLGREWRWNLDITPVKVT